MQGHQQLTVTEFKVMLPEWAGQEYRRFKTVQAESPLVAVLGYSLLLKSRMVNNCLLADTCPTTPIKAYSRTRPEAAV
jgi:hypothetical protein